MSNCPHCGEITGWLTGWKVIASHFDIGWRTAKKWHKNYDMPVLRTPEGRPTNTPFELDNWLRAYNHILSREATRSL